MRPVRREGGFVLVLVLAMLVVLSLLAGSIAATTSRLLEQATAGCRTSGTWPARAPPCCT